MKGRAAVRSAKETAGLYAHRELPPIHSLFLREGVR